MSAQVRTVRIRDVRDPVIGTKDHELLPKIVTRDDLAFGQFGGGRNHEPPVRVRVRWVVFELVDPLDDSRLLRDAIERLVLGGGEEDDAGHVSV